MHFKNIYIRDFGIFKNQKLDKLSKNLVVIGGKNRAGKSSFMDIIRYLPYGFPQDNSIPPALNQYYIEAELKTAAEDYNLTLNGFSKPELIDSSGESADLSSLYNNLDQLSYKQLFTISLNELQKLSELAKAKKSRKRIYSVLLGAGLSELIKLPEIADRYYNQAKSIGGTLGDPSVASFKAYYKEIKKAEEKRDEALKEVEEFNSKREELNNLEAELEKLNTKINKLQKNEFLLDLLKNNYELIENIEKLKIELEEYNISEIIDYDYNSLEKIKELKEKYKEIKEKFYEQKEELIKISSKDKFDELIDFILKNENMIKKMKNKEELYQERLKNIRENEKKINDNLILLENELKELNLSWKDPLSKLAEIEVDLIKQQELSKKLDSYYNLKDDIKSLESEIREIKDIIDLKEEKLSKLNFKSAESLLKRTLIIVSSFLSVGAAAFIFNYYPILYFSLALIFLTLIYHSSSYKLAQKDEAEFENLSSEIKKLKKDLNSLTEQLNIKEISLKNIEDLLEDYAQKLGIDEANYFPFLSDYYAQVKDKKSRYRLLVKEKEENERKKAELKAELQNISELIKEIKLKSELDFSFDYLNKESVFNRSEELFIDLERIEQLLLMLKNYSQLEKEYKEIKQKNEDLLQDFKKELDLEARINYYLDELNKSQNYRKVKEDYQLKKSQLNYSLNSSDKTKKYLDSYNNKSENSYQSFIKIYREYSSLEAVEKEQKEMSEEIINLKNDKEKLENKITTMKNKIEELSSSDKIEEAIREINEARSNLKKLAERYAVNKSIYYILNKLRARMIAKTEDELLKPAADILAKITDNEYRTIETSDNLEETEFKTINADGKIFENAKQLSRGTLEQLFLAVRISRIKEIKPPLPIVLDDSFVNFDQSHLYHSAEIISRLAEENQIFLLSCHPQLIEFINQLSDSAQYWKLEKGEFEFSSAEKLSEYLNHK